MGIDNAGPLLHLDTDSKSSAHFLRKMASGTLFSDFPKFSACELEQHGLMHGNFYFMYIQ